MNFRLLLPTLVLFIALCSCERSHVPKGVSQSADMGAVEGDAHRAAAALHLLSLKVTAGLLEQHSATENLFYSPYALYSALGLIYAGASGKTKFQVDDLLGLSHHGDLPALGRRTKMMEVGKEPSSGVPLELEVSNSLWVDKNLDASASFVDFAKSHYSVEPHEIDFSDAGAAALRINRWVKKRTQGEIDLPVPPELLKPPTKLVLVNAALFHASWAYQFDPKQTKPGKFVSPTGARQVPMMRTRSSMAYAEVGEMAQAVAIPYVGRTQMIILLPYKGRFDDVRRRIITKGAVAFDPDWPQPWTERMVELGMPKFSISSRLSIAEVLGALGMVDAFDNKKANFSAMITASEKLQIPLNVLIQETKIATDELGSGGAPGAKVQGAASEDQPSVSVNVWRPFFVLVRDTPTSAPLFIGQVVNP